MRPRRAGGTAPRTLETLKSGGHLSKKSGLLQNEPQTHKLLIRLKNNPGKGGKREKKRDWVSMGAEGTGAAEVNTT